MLWARDCTTAADRQTWLGDTPPGTSAVAYIETSWLQRVERETLTRYELPLDGFQDIDDVGMWVSSATVVPSRATRITDLKAELAACRTELRVVASLRPLKPAWNSSVHASGIRLRNAADWS